jgi:hypothetical protein
MSKSLKRVARALAEAGIRRNPGDARQHPHGGGGRGGRGLRDRPDREIHHLPGRGSWHGGPVHHGGRQQGGPGKASALAGEPLGKADAGLIRAQTGFVIGGVAPVGHLSPIRAWFDPRLLEFDTVWAAAGTPRHVFAIAPGELLRLSGAERAELHG